MPNPKHPAAKAGRFVRAVGLGIARELEKRADAPPKERPAPPPPPPPVRTGGVIGTAVFYAFIVGLVAGLLSVIKADELAAHGTPRLVFRLTLGGVLLAVALLLTSNWHLANQRLGQRLLTRIWGPRGAMNKRERFIARRVRDALTLVGIAFLAGAVYEILTAFVGTE